MFVALVMASEPTLAPLPLEPLVVSPVPRRSRQRIGSDRVWGPLPGERAEAWLSPSGQLAIWVALHDETTTVRWRSLVNDREGSVELPGLQRSFVVSAGDRWIWCDGFLVEASSGRVVRHETRSINVVSLMQGYGGWLALGFVDGALSRITLPQRGQLSLITEARRGTPPRVFPLEDGRMVVVDEERGWVEVWEANDRRRLVLDRPVRGARAQGPLFAFPGPTGCVDLWDGEWTSVGADDPCHAEGGVPADLSFDLDVDDEVRVIAGRHGGLTGWVRRGAELVQAWQRSFGAPLDVHLDGSDVYVLHDGGVVRRALWGESDPSGVAPTALLMGPGDLLYTGHVDGTVRTWNVVTGEPVYSADAMGPVEGLAGWGDTLLVRTAASTELWSLGAAPERIVAWPPAGHIGALGPGIAVLGGVKSAFAMEVPSGNVRWNFDHEGLVEAAMAPDGATVALRTREAALVLVALASGAADVVTGGDLRLWADGGLRWDTSGVFWFGAGWWHAIERATPRVAGAWGPTTFADLPMGRVVPHRAGVVERADGQFGATGHARAVVGEGRVVVMEERSVRVLDEALTTRWVFEAQPGGRARVWAGS